MPADATIAISLPIRKRPRRKTVTWSTPLTHVRIIPSRNDVNWPLCYCYTCTYEVLCEPHDLPEEMTTPRVFVPERDGLQLCDSYTCDHEVLWNISKDKSGSILFVPREDDL